jgi:phosphate transport system permease protein
VRRDLFTTDSNNLKQRYRSASIAHAFFMMATTVGLIALAVLLVSVIDRAFGLVVIQDAVDQTTLSSTPLEQLGQAELIQIIRANTRPARVRTVERDEGKLENLAPDALYTILIAEVVKPSVLKSYYLFESITQRQRIAAETARDFPEAHLEFRAWLNPKFLERSMSAVPQLAGVRTALFGSLWIIAITLLVAFPIGVGAAIYLEEYASTTNWFSRIIQTNIDNLAGVPSIVYGILGLAIFVRTFSVFTSGSLFGSDAGNGRTILSAGLTMALLILPILIINAQEAIRAVPNSLRQASYGLGATQWQTIWNHVLPYAFPGILTGTILAISRAIGETAPLILVGASSLINKDPSSIFSFFTALPIQIYNWTARPQAEFRNIAAAAILVLLIMLLSLNSVAIILRNRLSRRNT